MLDIEQLAKEYNFRYKNNTYIKQFNKKNPVPTYDIWLINKIFKKIYDNKSLSDKTFRILDFGCGDGRFFHVFEAIAKKLGKDSNTLELFCVDISYEAINSYNDKLISQNFQKTKNYLVKDNIKVKLITAESINDLAKIEHNIDLSLAMFDVINHIPERANRVETLEKIGKITNKYFIFTVTSPRIFKQEQKLYSKKRSDNVDVDLAKEDGDIYYPIYEETKTDEKDFMHLYNIKRLKEDIYDAGLLMESITPCAIIDIIKSKPNFLLCKIDEFRCRFLSTILPTSLVDKVAINMAAVAKKKG